MEYSEKETIDYLLKYHESIQKRLNQIDERGAGPINLATVVAATVAAVSLFIANEEITSKISILIPACVVVVISIHCYNNRLIAILSGCLAGAEDVLADLIGKNIYINNRGLTSMRHIPFFITNDIMGIMYLLLGISGASFAFWKIYNNSMIPVVVFYVYLIFFILFCLIYGFELWTNEEIKSLVRNYYHESYDLMMDNNSNVDFNSFDEEFEKRVWKKYFRRIFQIQRSNT